MDDAYAALLAKREELTEVHTREDLARVQAELDVLKDVASRESAEYQQVVLLNRAEAEQRAEMMRLQYQPRIDEAKRKADAARTKADATRTETEAMRRQVQLTTRLNRYDVAGIARAGESDSEYVCPKCGDTNASNIQIVGKGKRKVKIPWCVMCNIPLKKRGEAYVRTVSQAEYMEDGLKRLRGVPE